MYLKKEDKQQLLYNLEKLIMLGKGIENQMFDLIKFSVNCRKMGCKVPMDGYCFPGLEVRAYRIRCRQSCHNAAIS